MGSESHLDFIVRRDYARVFLFFFLLLMFKMLEQTGVGIEMQEETGVGTKLCTIFDFFLQ